MKAKFQGTPLFPKTKYNPEVDILSGDFGREVLAKYYRRVGDKYGNNLNLSVLGENNNLNLIVGSNPFAVVLVNEILTKENLRTATQADLELILKHRPDLNLKGTYEDTGLVLRSESDPNGYLAEDLTRQLRQRNLRFEYPVLLNLSDLLLRVDQDSKYGLAFNLKEEANPIYAPILNSPNSSKNSSNGSKFSSSNIDEATGLPKKVEKGERYLYTRYSGLSRLYLNRNLNLNSDDDGLNKSHSGGQVVVVVDGAATQKFSD